MNDEILNILFDEIRVLKAHISELQNTVNCLKNEHQESSDSFCLRNTTTETPKTLTT